VGSAAVCTQAIEQTEEVTHSIAEQQSRGAQGAGAGSIQDARLPRRQMCSTAAGRMGRHAHIKLLLGLRETVLVMGIDQENDCVDLREIVLPDLAGDLVAAKVKRAELDLGNRELLRS